MGARDDELRREYDRWPEQRPEPTVDPFEAGVVVMARTQRDVMRELCTRFGDEGRVVAAYAAAERRGDVARMSDVHGLRPEEYARRLYADGVKKGWLGSAGNPPAPAGLKSSTIATGGQTSTPKRSSERVLQKDGDETGSVQPAATGVTVPLDLGGISTPNLLLLSGGVIEELRRRRVVRTTNNPVADYAEFLAARAFELTLAARSESGYDGTDTGGLRYQVKSRRLTSANPSRQLGFIRGLDGDPFDYLVAILFKADYAVFRAALIPVAVVRSRATWVEYVHAWRLVLSEPVFELDTVTDVTERLRAAASRDLLISADQHAFQIDKSARMDGEG